MSNFRFSRSFGIFDIPGCSHRLAPVKWAMEQPSKGHQDSLLILTCDGDVTIHEGNWLRLWNSLGMGVAHDVWVGTDGIVYENSGPGGSVHRNSLASVLTGRKVIHIVARTAAHELASKVRFSESKLGALWDFLLQLPGFRE